MNFARPEPSIVRGRGSLQTEHIMRTLRNWSLLGVVALPLLLSACFVPVREEARPPPPPCPAYWQHGFTDRWGNWHPGHWVCR